MELSDLVYEPNEYAAAVEWYQLCRLDTKKHLNDDLASKLIDIALFGVRELREIIEMSDQHEADYREQQIILGERADQ